VDEEDDLVVNADTSGQSIHYADLGNLNDADGGSIDFDDFDSRRSERPGRLLVGDANGDGNLSTADVVAVLQENKGGAFAAGQPDCNEDGQISTADVVCVLSAVKNQ